VITPPLEWFAIRRSGLNKLFYLASFLIWRDICPKSPILLTPSVFYVPIEGNPIWSLPLSFAPQN